MSALLEIEDLEVTFGGRTAAVRGASLRVEKGETHCLVGESGCGKSVTALAVMGLLARGGHRSAKRMSFAGTDLLSLPDRDMARIRGNRMSMIFQEPMTSLNPAFTVGSQMAEVLHAPQGRLARRRARARGRADGPRRHHGAGIAARPVSAPALGRAAPARHDRDGADVRSRAAGRRRADHRARRHRAGADPAAARLAAGASSASRSC